MGQPCSHPGRSWQGLCLQNTLCSSSLTTFIGSTVALLFSNLTCGLLQRYVKKTLLPSPFLIQSQAACGAWSFFLLVLCCLSPCCFVADSCCFGSFLHSGFQNGTYPWKRVEAVEEAYLILSVLRPTSRLAGCSCQVWQSSLDTLQSPEHSAAQAQESWHVDRPLLFGLLVLSTPFREVV